MLKMWSHVFRVRLLALTGASGILLAFPGCGSHWWDYAVDFGAGFLASQVAKGFMGGLGQ